MAHSSLKNNSSSSTATEPGSTREIGISVDAFRTQLRKEVETVCRDLGKNYDKEQDRGFAFQVWTAELLLQLEGIDADPLDIVHRTNDLKVDIAFDDEDARVLILAQTKFVSLASNPDIPEAEVNDFFRRHDIFSKEDEWVAKHASDVLHDLLSDYQERLKGGWKIKYIFVSTGKASDRVKALAAALDATIKTDTENVSFELHDFYGLKELYTRSRSLEASISPFIDIDVPQQALVVKERPHRTLLCIVKGNALVNLYRKERDSLFAYNVRSFLGKRVNKEIVDTAKKRPSEFYYFNNGVSAVCTRIEDKGSNQYRFYNFQIINGAQTVGSLAAVRDLSSDCEVLLRVTEGASVKTEKGFNADIIRFNNTQNVVKASDFRSNDNIQLWIEDRLNKTRARGAIFSPLKFIRKRSFHRARAAAAIKFEDLAKIRFAFLSEQTINQYISN